MTTLRHRMTHTGNEIGVYLHRVAKGRLDGFGDSHVLMLTCPGRRTGLPRSTMVRYLDHDGGYVVWGTGNGSPTEPDWFRNLRTAGRAQVEIGRIRHTVRPEILDSDERDRVWHDIVLAAAPGVTRLEAKAGRIIPVALLHPLDAESEG